MKVFYNIGITYRAVSCLGERMALGPFSKRDHIEITTLGLEFASAVGLCTWAGYALDKKWGSSPWLLVAGAFAGFGLGFYMVVRAAKNMSRAGVNLNKADKTDGRS